jgi:MFS family permease
LTVEKSSPGELGFKNVVNLGLVSMFTDISTEMILGVLPIFVISQLGATKELLGLMEGAAEFMNDIFRIFSGMITDRVGRLKPLILLGYGLSTLAKPFFAFSTTFTHAFAVRLTDRVGKGIRTSPRDTLLSESVKESKSGRAFGFHESADQAGAVIGPILAFLLLPLFGFRGLFLVSLIPGAISVFILAFFVRDRRHHGTSTTLFKTTRTVLTRRFSIYLVVMGIFALGAYNFSFVLVKAGSLGVQTGMIPLVYATLNIATVVIGYPFGILADRYGRENLLIGGFVAFFVASLLGFWSTQGVLIAFVIALVYGIYFGISDSLQRALVPSFVSSELKGTAYAVYYLVVGVGSLIANLAFGLLWDRVSVSAAFEYSLILSFLAIVGLTAFIITNQDLIGRRCSESF